MPRHVHADLIHKWADGAKIQVKRSNGWEDLHTPNWDFDAEYRTKPRIIRREGWVNLYKSLSHAGWVAGCDVHISKEEAFRCAKADCIATAKIEWEETE